ncbi:AAA family ATPase [Nitrincola alkalilacustris]|uniref:AAA family ATPase n=1 Tax=Nitrincola alkalilacustris TaxID=1571224 RepID=UPI0014563FAA|nr:AAA family ATPase [Nitrincola alkalilacustris]
MIINGISLKNFQCYYGEHHDNKMDFSSGVNLIIGNNGGGKSKLFDAFYWVIYNQIFQSDTRVFIPTSQYKEKIISDKAKSLTQDDSTARAEVTLHVIDSQEREFRITRIYKAKKISEREWLGNRDSELLIEEIKNSTPQIVRSHNHENILSRVIPGHLKPYMWFQGEQVDSLMNLSNKSALMQTINLLSDISDYDKLIEIAKSGALKANKDLSKARKDTSNNQAESERLARQESVHRTEILGLERDIADYKLAVQSAKEGVERLVGQLSDAERKIQLKQKRDAAESERKKAEAILDQRVKALNGKLFSDLWLLRNVEPFTEKFISKYKEYHNQHGETLTALKLTKHRLPVDMPRPVHVQDMLDAHECFVCGREAADGSEAFERIKSLLNREKPNVKDAFINDCSKLFETLYENTLELRHSVKKLKENIPEEFKNIYSLRSSVKSASETVKSIDQEFEELLKDDSSDNIVAEFRQHEANRTRYENLLKVAEAKLRDVNMGLVDALNEQAKLSKGKVDASVELAAEVWGALQRLTCSTKEFVFSELVAELENSANKIFTEMTARNRSITGRLCLNIVSDEMVRAEIVDGEGFALSGSNDSNIILVKLSLMMAILKSKVLWSKNYSMVTDAPTSKMASEYSQGFYDALSNNFTQSIVMTYDFLNDSDIKKLEGVKLGKIYRLDPQYPGGNREDRSDLSVRINEVFV